MSAPFDFMDPAASGLAARSAFDEALADLEELRQKDVVNLPTAPQPQNNPFANPVVMLGMSLQGRSAEAITAGTQIARFNRARQDAYEAQVLQAHNYRQLRQQRFATTLADLQTRAAQSELQARERAFGRIETAAHRTTQAEQFKTTEARLQAASDANLALRQELQNYQLGEGKIVSDLRAKLANDPDFQRLSIRLEGLKSGIIVSSDAQGNQLQKSIDTMEPAERQRELSTLRLQISTGIMDIYGGTAPQYAQKQLELYGSLLDALSKIDTELASAPERATGPLPEGEAAVATALGEARLQRQFAQATPERGEDFDLTSGRGATEFLDAFQDMLSIEEQLPLEEFAGERAAQDPLARDLGIDPGLSGAALESGRASALRLAGERLNAADPHTNISAYKGAVLDVTREVGRQMLSGDRIAETPKQFIERAKQQLMQEHGIRKAFLDSRSVTRLLNQLYSVGG